jgi:hypothetical protein
MLTLALETVAAFALARHGFHYFEQRARSVGKVSVFAVDEAQLPFQLQLANRDADQFSPRQFGLYADFRKECHAVSQSHELLDGL